MRYGNSSNDFDIINYDIGDIRNILGSASNPSTGSFKWIDGDVNALDRDWETGILDQEEIDSAKEMMSEDLYDQE